MSSTKTIGRIFDLTIDCRNVRARAELSLQRHFQLFFKSFSSHFPPRLKDQFLLGVAESFGKLEQNLASTPSLECLRQKTIGRIFDLSRQRQSFIFHFLKIFNHAGFRPKYKTASRSKSRRIFREDNFSSSLLPRSKIVKVSLVDGFTGMS